jgi:carboxyl-terminal processing protease
MHLKRCIAPALIPMVASLTISLLTFGGAASATGQSEPATAHQQAAIVQDAFDLLIDRYVHPLNSADLLGPGWAALEQEALQQQAPPPGPAPTFTGERAADIGVFQAALEEYVGQYPALPPGFVPAHAVIRGMVAAVNEGHTAFLDPPAYAGYLEWARGATRYGGIGARVKGPGLRVAEVYEDAPAVTAGLHAGDVIEQVDGTVIDGLTTDQAAALLRGSIGSQLEVRVRRMGMPAPLTISVKRALVSPAPVAEGILGENVGYLRLRSFPEDASVAIRVDDAIDRFAHMGVRGLVVDVRGNAGGRLDTGAAILSRFLPAGTPLFDEHDRSGQPDLRRAAEATVYCGPLVLLVDGSTASMGEIFTAVLREHGAGPVVGTTTAGSVAGGKTFALDDGSALEVTVREIVTANGRALNGIGVAPDEVVNASSDGDTQDLALERATALVPEAGVAPSGCDATLSAGL